MKKRKKSYGNILCLLNSLSIFKWLWLFLCPPVRPDRHKSSTLNWLIQKEPLTLRSRKKKSDKMKGIVSRRLKTSASESWFAAETSAQLQVPPAKWKVIEQRLLLWARLVYLSACPQEQTDLFFPFITYHVLCLISEKFALGSRELQARKGS